METMIYKIKTMLSYSASVEQIMSVAQARPQTLQAKVVIYDAINKKSHPPSTI